MNRNKKINSKQGKRGKKNIKKPDINISFVNKVNTSIYKTIILLLSVVFFFSVFKNISYPLFWSDEGMTVVGAERVLRFGYPKIDDGRNILYDLVNKNPRLGANQKNDAYIGGAGWAQYYLGTIGVTFASFTDNIYKKTGIIRSSFAIMGILGLIIFMYSLSLLFNNKLNRLQFLAGFALLNLLSISLGLHLKEARYYSPTILFVLSICSLYILHRYVGKFNHIYFSIGLSVLFALLFLSFAPVCFILLLSVGISETIILVNKIIRHQKLAEIWETSKWIYVSGILSLLFLLPLIVYFKTFEISKAMTINNNFTWKLYYENISAIFINMTNNELLWLMVFLKVIILIYIKKIDRKSVLFKSTGFLFLFFCICIPLIAKIPNLFFTRYIIYLQPILSAMILIDIILIYQQILITRKLVFTITTSLLIAFISFHIINNTKYYNKRLYELFHIYKGPLDYTIPFIKEHYSNTQNLVIAANYEEACYMYYLRSKVIVGFTGYRIETDKNLNPDVICYRKFWNLYRPVFNDFVKRDNYKHKYFEVYDTPVNYIPELSYHKFSTHFTDWDQEKTMILYK